MKVKVGGSMSYKVQVAAYEPLDVSAFVEIEKEIENEDGIEEINLKLNEILKHQVNTRMAEAVINYRKNIASLKKNI